MGVFDENLEANLQQLAQELKSGTFEPFPVRRVYIPKAGGRVRPLGIPSVRDRIVQEALRMILEPIKKRDSVNTLLAFGPTAARWMRSDAFSGALRKVSDSFG